MLPANVTAAMVSRARLVVFTGAVTTPGTFNVYQVQSTWSENGVTYATRPTVGTTSYGVGTVTGVSEYIEVPVSGLVQAWITNPSSNFGLELKPIGSTNFAIDTKDSTTHSHQPILEIDLTGPAGPSGPIGTARRARSERCDWRNGTARSEGRNRNAQSSVRGGRNCERGTGVFGNEHR